MKAYSGLVQELHSFLTLSLEGSEQLTSCYSSCTQVKIPPVADEKEIESILEAVWMLWTRENILPLPQETEENHENPSLSSERDFNLGTLNCATGLLSNQLQHFALTL